MANGLGPPQNQLRPVSFTPREPRGLGTETINPFREGPTIDPFEGEPLVGGNVDLFAQPAVRNPDGSISTVRSSSYNLDGRETLLPAVTPDGRNLQTDDQIVDEYLRTGRHLGQFATPADANAYAEQLHNDYAAGRYKARPSASPFPDQPREGYTPRPMAVSANSPIFRDPIFREYLRTALDVTPQGMLDRLVRQGAPTAAQRYNAPDAPPQPPAPEVVDDYDAAVRAAQANPYNRPDATPRAYRGGVRAEPATPRQVPNMTPDQQAIVDAFWDEMEKWTQTDEQGNRRVTATRLDLGQMGRGERRFIEQEEAAEQERQIAPAPPKKSRGKFAADPRGML